MLTATSLFQLAGLDTSKKIKLIRHQDFNDQEDRLVIDWGGSTRSWHQWLRDKEVVQTTTFLASRSRPTTLLNISDRI